MWSRTWALRMNTHPPPLAFTTVRTCPCRAPSAVGPQLPAAQLAALQPALLARLDDSTNRVRVAACSVLGSWLASLLAPAMPAGGLGESDAAALASSMLIHLDDPDDEVAQAVCGVLCQLATAAPGAVRPLAQAAAAQHLRASLLDQVLAACGRPPA